MRKEDSDSKCKGNNAATVNLIMSIVVHARRSKLRKTYITTCDICIYQNNA
mgnify:CR=1 FL=1